MQTLAPILLILLQIFFYLICCFLEFQIKVDPFYKGFKLQPLVKPCGKGNNIFFSGQWCTIFDKEVKVSVVVVIYFMDYIIFMESCNTSTISIGTRL